VFQQRTGLVTVEAVTAAGAGGYEVLDVTGRDGVALADAAVPNLVAPFVISADAGSRTGRG
jgi:putative membrane protein